MGRERIVLPTDDDDPLGNGVFVLAYTHLLSHGNG